MSSLCPPHPDDVFHGAPANPRNQSACGAPFRGFMPDGYVNPEWFGLLANVPNCNCSLHGDEPGACEAAAYSLQARSAFWRVMETWVGANALAEARANATALLHDPQSAAVCERVAPSCAPYPSAPRLQQQWGTIGLTLDCQPWLMRAISYSPAPRGDDPGYSEPWGDYFTDEYAGVFTRDLTLMKDMGANTIRIYAFKTSIRHTV